MKNIDFLNYNFDGKNIVIIGKPSSGKTFVSEFLKKKLPNHCLIHTDDFLRMDEQLAITNILSIARKSKFHIIEGVMCYQILNTGFKHGIYSPNIVINVDISYPTLTKNYARTNKNINSIKGFCFRHKKLLDEYLSMNPNIEFINIKNDERCF